MKKKKKSCRDLTREEWKCLDEALLKLAGERLGGVQDLIDDEYKINPNVLHGACTLGKPLDCTLAERAARKILEKRLSTFRLLNKKKI